MVVSRFQKFALNVSNKLQNCSGTHSGLSPGQQNKEGTVRLTDLKKKLGGEKKKIDRSLLQVLRTPTHCIPELLALPLTTHNVRVAPPGSVVPSAVWMVWRQLAVPT